MSGWTPVSEPPCVRPGIAANSIFPRSKLRSRSASATCRRWRTRSGTLLPGGAYTRGLRPHVRPLPRPRWRTPRRRLPPQHRTAGGERPPKRVEPVPTGRRRERSPIPGWVLASAVSLALIGLAVGIGLTGGGDDEGGSPGSTPAASGEGERPKRGDRATAAAGAKRCGGRVGGNRRSLGLPARRASRSRWSTGEILEEGAEAGPFRSERL